MHVSDLMIVEICLPSVDTFKKQPIPSHVGLLTEKKKNVFITGILRNFHPKACNILWQIDKLLLVYLGLTDCLTTETRYRCDANGEFWCRDRCLLKS